MNHNLLFTPFRKITLSAMLLLAVVGLQAQSSVYDVIAGSNDHNSLQAAIEAAGLDGTLDDATGTFTVFAPNDAAFEAAVAALGIDIPTLLASPDLADILTYHVLGAEVMSADLTNGQTAQPLNAANTVKVTVTGDNNVFINQAQVITPDLAADNGVVHSLDAVILASQTVADVILLQH